MATKPKTPTNISEGFDIDEAILSGEPDLKAYQGKVQRFLDETFATADELAEEGENMLRENVLRSPTASERRRLILTLVGFLRQTRNSIGNVLRIRFLVG